MKKIIQVLNKVSPLTEKDISDVSGILTPRTLNKGEYWIEAGNRNHEVAFLNDGYLRKYYLRDGDEITDFFYFENDFCADLPSIIGNTKPAASIIAMEKTTLTTFAYEDFNALCRQSITLEHLHRMIIEFTFLRFYKRTVSFILQTPKERYDELLTSYNTVLQKAAQYHIASYLGISAQHLSRLRGEM